MVDFIIGLRNNLRRGLVIFIADFSYKIIPCLIACNSAMEVIDVLEVFQVIKLVFDSAVYCFDIAVITPCPYWDSFVDTACVLNASTEQFLRCSQSILANRQAFEADFSLAKPRNISPLLTSLAVN